MRPSALSPYFLPVLGLKGVGGKIEKILQKLNIFCIKDLLFHLPVTYIDRTQPLVLSSQNMGKIVTGVVEVSSYEFASHAQAKRVPSRVYCVHPQGILQIAYFHLPKDVIMNLFPIGQKRVISGKLERYRQDWQMVHPDYVMPETAQAEMAVIEPVYGLSAGISNKQMRSLIAQAIRKMTPLPEWHQPSILAKHHFTSFQDTIKQLHEARSDTTSSESTSRAFERLKYDESLAYQLALRLVRKEVKQQQQAKPILARGILREQLESQLPFTLTSGQQDAIATIIADMEKPEPMLRLLQGDVGSGKTAVALMAAAQALEVGKQVIILAPTEILASQHAEWIESQLGKVGIASALLIGKMTKKQKETVTESFKKGDIQMLIGTHALLQECVEAADLGLVVIDEQHRFGVKQRMQLVYRHPGVGVLLMTATPIPRTLTMVAYGDMDCSLLTEKPASRKPIDTRVVPISRMKDMIAAIERAMKSGEKIYWICPLIETSEVLDVQAAEDRFASLQKTLHLHKNKIGLMHGRMKKDQRDQVMAAFKQGELQLLVATTVVEVGVDVPDATIMVIEHAERFGLSQLHQLRGRVGRGEKASCCMLLYDDKSGTIARKRMSVMRESNDGFFLAEEDLRIRGSGELMGVKQSGLPQFQFVDIVEDSDWMQLAANDAKYTLETDSHLASERGKALRQLLYLFQYDQLMNYLQA